MLTDLAVRDDRQLVGTRTEHKFIGLLLYCGKNIYLEGVETWMPAWAHSKLRRIYDKDIELLRHFPDLATDKAQIQVKTAPTEQGYPTVTIEEASYNASFRLQELGLPVLLVWEFQDGKFHGQWVEKLKIKKPETKRENTNGSHTPYLLVEKSCLVVVDTKFVKENL